MLALKYQNLLREAGCDEAGRGCLAGPVFAAAVVLPDDFYHPDLNDSKLLSETKRDELRIFIEENSIDFAVASCSAEEIDEINILKASFRSMHKALDKLTIKPGFLLIDGNRFTDYRKMPYACIIKGDSKFMPIAAASILAKTYRDEYMQKIHKEYPMYRWAENKGYPTKAHRDAISRYGSCDHHRKSFTLLPAQMSIGL